MKWSFFLLAAGSLFCIPRSAFAQSIPPVLFDRPAIPSPLIYERPLADRLLSFHLAHDVLYCDHQKDSVRQAYLTGPRIRILPPDNMPCLTFGLRMDPIPTDRHRNTDPINRWPAPLIRRLSIK